MFNKLASELTADLNAAINEIDSLKREVQRLKSGSGKTNKTSTLQKKTTSSKTTRSHPTKGNKPATTHSEGSRTGHRESGHETKPSDDTSSFVFPTSHSIRPRLPSLLRPETTSYLSQRRISARLSGRTEARLFAPSPFSIFSFGRIQPFDHLLLKESWRTLTSVVGGGRSLGSDAHADSEERADQPQGSQRHILRDRR